MDTIYIRNATGFNIQFNIDRNTIFDNGGYFDWAADVPTKGLFGHNTDIGPVKMTNRLDLDGGKLYALANDNDGYSGPKFGINFKTYNQGIILPDTMAEIMINDINSLITIKAIMPANDSMSCGQTRSYIATFRPINLKSNYVLIGINRNSALCANTYCDPANINLGSDDLQFNELYRDPNPYTSWVSTNNTIIFRNNDKYQIQFKEADLYQYEPIGLKIISTERLNEAAQNAKSFKSWTKVVGQGAKFIDGSPYGSQAIKPNNYAYNMISQKAPDMNANISRYSVDGPMTYRNDNLANVQRMQLANNRIFKGNTRQQVLGFKVPGLSPNYPVSSLNFNSYLR